ncbi:hypothetical protein [Pseudomonas fluorescens]|uniref:hypothetical protein n=1 Tax=Pseudomonas fluorescens TaxID=294 RepID=UPI001CD2DFFB|nr:hypothetical protein [Pseudomonas fluorescens]
MAPTFKATVADHYETHLAPVYLWMAGGFDAAVSRGEAEIEAVLPNRASGTTAVDLGAGFGMHTIPLWLAAAAQWSPWTILLTICGSSLEDA